MQNVAPLRRLSRTSEIEPPCDSVILRAMVRPIPVPSSRPPTDKSPPGCALEPRDVSGDVVADQGQVVMIQPARGCATRRPSASLPVSQANSISCGAAGGSAPYVRQNAIARARPNGCLEMARRAVEAVTCRLNVWEP